MTRMDARTRLAAILLIAAAVALGAALRIVNLGEPELVNDELIHYFTAKSLQGGEGFVLPSGETYSRGTDITRLVAVSTSVVEDPELGARLPSLVFGLANMLLLAFVAWRIAGPWAAVLAVALLAVYPTAVYQSRLTRFYTYQLNFGLIALLGTWIVVQFAGRAHELGRDQLRRQWMWAAMAGLGFLLALRVQVTTFSVMAGAAIAIALAALWDLREGGVRSWRRSVPFQLSVGGLVVAAAVLVAAPGYVRQLTSTATGVPEWAGGAPGNTLAYYYALSESFPAIVALIPAIFLVLLLTNFRQAIFLGIWFGVPLLLHSFLFGFKNERYILLAIPALFIATGAVVAALSSWLRIRLEKLVPGLPYVHFTVASIIVAIWTFALVTTPAFSESRRMADGRYYEQLPDWKRAAELIEVELSARPLLIGSSDASASLFYWPRIDFSISTSALTRPSRRAAAARNLPAKGIGSPEFYVGVPMLPTPDAIRTLATNGDDVLIAVDDVRIRFGNVDAALVRVLESEGTELCAGSCGPLRLFRWAPGVSADSVRRLASPVPGLTQPREALVNQ